MQRTPAWVFVAAAAVQLAGLGLCVWAMERVFPPAPRARPVPQPPGPCFGPSPARTPDRGDPAFRPPPFLTDHADEATQFVVGDAAEGPFAFAFYGDGNIRFVDADGGRYAGRAESARARMHEVDGRRAFTVQIGVGADHRLQATFTGGAHDHETIPLEPLVGWSAA